MSRDQPCDDVEDRRPGGVELPAGMLRKMKLRATESGTIDGARSGSHSVTEAEHAAFDNRRCARASGDAGCITIAEEPERGLETDPFGDRGTYTVHVKSRDGEDADGGGRFQDHRKAKAVVCFADGEPIQAVVPADLEVDFDRLAAVTEAHSLQFAEEDELRWLYPDCERGAMPPLGPLYRQTVFVDGTLAAEDRIVFNAGTHADAIAMRYEDFAAITHPIVAWFARRPAAA